MPACSLIGVRRRSAHWVYDWYALGVYSSPPLPAEGEAEPPDLRPFCTCSAVRSIAATLVASGLHVNPNGTPPVTVLGERDTAKWAAGRGATQPFVSMWLILECIIWET